MGLRLKIEQQSEVSVVQPPLKFFMDHRCPESYAVVTRDSRVVNYECIPVYFTWGRHHSAVASNECFPADFNSLYAVIWKWWQSQIRGKCCIPFRIIGTIALSIVENALFFVEQEQDGSMVMHQIPSPIHLHGGWKARSRNKEVVFVVVAYIV